MPDTPDMSEIPDHKRWADKSVFTTGEAAVVCGVSQQTIIRCFDAGRLSGFRVPGSRFRRIPRPNLIAFMRASEIDTTPLVGPRRHILIVDSSAAFAASVAELLRHDDRNDVHVADSAWRAGLICGQLAPNVLVIDAVVSGLDTPAVLASLRDMQSKCPHTLVLVRSSNEPLARQFVRAGATEAIEHPTDPSAVADRVADFLGR